MVQARQEKFRQRKSDRTQKLCKFSMKHATSNDNTVLQGHMMIKFSIFITEEEVDHSDQ